MPVDLADFRRRGRNPKKSVGILYTWRRALAVRIAKCLNSLHLSTVVRFLHNNRYNVDIGSADKNPVRRLN